MRWRRYLSLTAVGLALLACGDDDGSGVVADPPGSPAELLSAMAVTLGRGDEVLHIDATWEATEQGENLRMGSYEAWIDFARDVGRVEYEKEPDNDTDTPEWMTYQFVGDEVYRMGPDDDTPRLGLRGEYWRGCLGLGTLVEEAVACGLGSQPANFEGTNVRLLDNPQWEGRAAIGIGLDWEAGVKAAYEFLVDPNTYLPLGVRMTAERGGEVFATQVISYEATWLDNVDRSLFDPRAEGYLPPDEEQLELLDNPLEDAPVYWLGRMFDGGSAIGAVHLISVDQRYAHDRPTLITLFYKGESGGRLIIEVWKEEGWRSFLSLLDQVEGDTLQFGFPIRCLHVEEYEVSGHRVRILAGYNTERTPPRGTVGGTAGVAPTSTPKPPVACPDRPHDEFIAEVYVDAGYVVTLNPPTGSYDLGDRYEAFDSPDALLALVEGLRLRQPGE